RGAYGGYMLSRHPKNVKAGEVIRVLEGPITLVENIEDEEKANQALWLKMTAAIRHVLDTTSLEDLLNQERSGTDNQEAYMFYIYRKESMEYVTHLVGPYFHNTGPTNRFR